MGRDFGVFKFDSYILSENNLFRLLNVDNRLIIPYNTDIRIIVSRADVIHS
uniref:BLTX749 n=1 Tax=Nephila pilipes TaxID=299642 RepID=A0A076L356_NEPPI|nr:BLTX749 [Nephila pilipes]